MVLLWDRLSDIFFSSVHLFRYSYISARYQFYGYSSEGTEHAWVDLGD